jgi:2-hydroxycyclohexanecarboxyl-CoA dehydrogenase
MTEVAWVTGGASGIGEAVVDALAGAGRRVGVLDVRAAAAAAASVRCDVSDPVSVAEAARELREAVGPPGILVNCAGVSDSGAVAEFPLERWNRLLAVNLTGTLLVTQQALPAMVDAGYGRILNIASGQAFRPTAGMAGYAASKAGVVALTKTIAVEAATAGVTANAIAPGIVDTPMTRKLWPDERAMVETVTSSAIANPMRALIQPADIASVVLFLCSAGARYMTGQVLHVNAGSL